MEAKLILQIGLAAERLGQTAEAVASYKKSADIYRRLQDRRSLALTLQYLGVNYEVAGDLKNADAVDDESVQAPREAGLTGVGRRMPWQTSAAAIPAGRLLAA